MKRFEEIKVWQDARKFVKVIDELTSKGEFRKDFGMKDQIQRAAASVTSNIAEGYERDSNKELIKFPGYSKGSIGEVRSLLWIAADLNSIDLAVLESATIDAISITTRIFNFTKYLRAHIRKSHNV